MPCALTQEIIRVQQEIIRVRQERIALEEQISHLVHERKILEQTWVYRLHQWWTRVNN